MSSSHTDRDTSSPARRQVEGQEATNAGRGDEMFSTAGVRGLLGPVTGGEAPYISVYTGPRPSQLDPTRPRSSRARSVSHGPGPLVHVHIYLEAINMRHEGELIGKAVIWILWTALFVIVSVPIHA